MSDSVAKKIKYTYEAIESGETVSGPDYLMFYSYGSLFHYLRSVHGVDASVVYGDDGADYFLVRETNKKGDTT